MKQKRLKLVLTLACAALSTSLHAGDGTWTNNNSANWSVAANWQAATIADGSGFTANFSSVNITAARTVTLDSTRTIGTLRFADMTTADFDWTLGVANNAILNLSGTPVIDVTNRTVTVNPVIAGSEGYTKTGGGTLVVANTANTVSGPIYLNAGTTRFVRTGSLGSDPGAYVANAINLSGGIMMNSDSILVVTPSYGITLNGAGGIQAGWSRPVTIESPIVGSGNLTIQSDATPGVISLNAINTYSGTTTVAGWLQVNGSLDAANSVNVNSGGVLMGTGVINGIVTVNSGGNIGGGPLFTPGTLTINTSTLLNSCTLHADLGATPADTGDLIAVNGDLTLTGTITVSITPMAGTLAPGTYRLINYTGALNGSAANLVAAPTRYSVTFDTSTAGQVNMVVASGAPASLAWKGVAGATWDVNVTPNFVNGGDLDRFRQGDNVTLDNNGNSVLPVVTYGPLLVNTVVPGSLVVDSSKDYTLSGGRLAGPMTLTKKGSGLLILTGGNSSLPNYFDGPVVVEAGRLRVGYARAMGSTNNGAIVRSGASLDVNGLDLGFEAITVEGSGPDGNGALVNYGGGQNNALRLVTMTGDTTVGGTGRFDIRNLEGIASLSTGGNGYNLTKKGPNQFTLVGVAVDPALGTVDIQEGVFGFESSSTLGNPALPLILGTNASVRFWNLSNPFDKPTIIKGGTSVSIDNGSGVSVIVGPVTNLADSVWNVSGTSLRVSSDITGAGGITKTGGSPLYFDGILTYAGPTVLSAGSLVLGTGSALSTSPAITLGGSTTLLDLSAPASVSGSGYYELNGAIGQKLSGSGTVAGNLLVGTGCTLVPGHSPGILTNRGNLKLSGATAIFDLGATTNAGGGINDLVVVNGDLTLDGPIELRINALAPLDTVNPYTIALYSGALDLATASLNITSDSRYTFTVDTQTVPGAILVRAAAVGTGVQTLTWQGSVAGSETVWDIKTTANWSNSTGAAEMFYQGDRVAFDDTATSTEVSLSTTGTPASVTVSNQARDFVWSGSGKMSGPTTLVKQGTGKLTLANRGLNDNAGATTVSAGTLQVGNGGTAGNLNGAAITNAGTVVFNRSDAITVANTFYGAGKVEKRGSGLMVLSSAQANLTGPIAVSEGTLRPGTATSLGTVAGGTTVADGATLDVNGLNLGAEIVTVKGSGVGGQGAIINTGAGQNNAFQYVVLGGDTTFGGPNRWDIRAGTTPYLQTGGNPYNLTKVGNNQFSLVGVTVDAALADIDVKAGILSYESTTSGLGAPGRTLTIRSNASLLVWGATVPLNKQITVEGGGTLNAGSGTANVISGPVKLADGMANLNSASGVTIYYTGALSGPGGIVKGDAGSVHLVGPNTFAGNIVNNYGNLVLSNSLAAGTAKSLAVNYNTGVSGGAGVRLFLRNGITTPSSLTGIFSATAGGGDYRCSITSDVLANTWTGPMLLQGSGIVGFYSDFTTNALNISGPITSTNGFTGTAFFRGSHGVASLAGTVSGQVQIPQGVVALTDNTVWKFSNPGNSWFRTLIAYGKVVLGVDNGACPTAELVLGQAGSSTGTLDLNGFNQTVPSITTINGANHWITNGSATADSVFTFNGGTNVSVLNGRIVDGSRKLSLTVASGTLNLLGNNTYRGDTLISGGTLGLASAATLAGTPYISVAAGATLDTGGLPAGLTLTTGQTLVGAGRVQGSLTVGAGATLSAGVSVGELAVTGGLVLAGTNVADINTAILPANDLVRADSVTYGGSLVVQNLGPALAAGSSFKLFSANAYAGAFAEIIPDKPGAGLVWDASRLAVDGTLSVLQGISLAPTNITAVVSGGTLTLSWPASYTGWRLEAQTNTLNTGLSNIWAPVAGSTTTNQIVIPIDPLQPTVFYRLGYTVAP